MQFLGCDTVSRIYGIGKDKITTSQKFLYCDVAPIFYNHLSPKLDIPEAGKKLLLGLYNRVNIGSQHIYGKVCEKFYSETRTATNNNRIIKIPPFSSLPPNTDMARAFFKHPLSWNGECKMIKWSRYLLTKFLLLQNY